MVRSVTIEIKGGLGNQLFQFALGYSLGQHYDCNLLLNTSYYDNSKDRKLQLTNYTFPFRQSTNYQNLLLGSKTNFINKTIHNLGIGRLIFKNYIEENKSFKFQKKVFTMKRNFYLNGYWQNPKYFENYLSDISNLFKISFSDDKAFTQYQKLILSSESVALHVRRGDYVHNEKTSLIHKTCDINYYLNAIKIIKKKISNPIFFVFSDDISWCKKYFKFLKNIVFVDKTNNNLKDFELIKICKHSILSNSTFSWWASLLGNNDSRLVFLPKYWQKNILTRSTNLHEMKKFEVIVI